MKHRFARFAIGGMCLARLAGALVPTTASASTISDKKARAQELQEEIDANGEKISMLAERYNEAKLRLGAATTKIVVVQARAIAAQSETDRIASDVGGRAKYAAAAADRDTQLLGRLAASREDLEATHRDLESARKSAQTQIDAIEASRHDVEAANAAQARLLSQVKGEIATLIRQAEQRRAAAEKARSDAEAARLRLLATRAPARTVARAAGTPSSAAAVTHAPSTPGVDPANLAVPNVPAPSPGAAAAVAYAKAQLGKPYRYAGVGPDAYDCSGLTMMAWGQSGVSMPHGSIAQGNMFPRVPDNALAPGDLVIYYPDHHHVGMYVGNGMTISATHTGDFVRLQPVFRTGFQFAVRPG
jgi:cell wall-associated NlpC family hydrolase